ncbi:MAG: YvcK family protein [Clostridia bacterium]|nr:YvcK family protein [Clostridia bacterium]
MEDIKIYRGKVNNKVVVIGGGTGLSTMLRGLKKLPIDITAIVAVSDDGGGSGMIRSDLGILPPGDIRNCILALSNAEPTMTELLRYRFQDGNLKGQSFGNLFLAAMNGISMSFSQAVLKMCKILSVNGQVLPVTEEDVNLKGIFNDQSSIIGESKISEYIKKTGKKLDHVELIPENPKALDDALEEIRKAKMIILGPGSLYTSIIPNLLVNGISEAIRKSSAKKVYIANVMTQQGETEGYTLSDHISALHKHSFEDIIEYCLVNNRKGEEIYLEKYRLEGAEPVIIDDDKFTDSNIKFIKKDFLNEGGNYLRHDPRKLADVIYELLTEN